MTAIVPEHRDMAPPVCVIVVNYRTTDALAGCVAAFDAQDYANLDVIVVDNASDADDVLLNAVEQHNWEHPVRVVRNRVNRGYAGAINDALAMTSAPYVVFSNVDVQPERDLVAAAAAALDVDERRGTIQPLLLRQRTPPVIDTTGHVLDSARLISNRAEGHVAGALQAGPVFGASGALVMHRRAMLDDVRWRSGEILTEDLFAFFEDVELDWRARRFGWTAWFEPAAIAFHERGGIGPRRSALVEELNWANRLLVAITCDDLRHVAMRLPLVVVTTAARSAELLARSPHSFPRAMWRLVRGIRRAFQRRRELNSRAARTSQEVLEEWLVSFNARAWIGTWRRRRRQVRQRAQR